MTDDLPARLRDTPNWRRETFNHWKDCVLEYDRAPFEAADEIERLRAEVETLRKALRDLVQLEADGHHAGESAIEYWERARAALAARAEAKPARAPLTLDMVRALPTIRGVEFDGEEADGTPRRWRDRPFVSLRKLEELLRAHGVDAARAEAKGGAE